MKKKKSFQIPPTYGDIVMIHGQYVVVTRIGNFYFHVFPEYSAPPHFDDTYEKYFHLNDCTDDKCFCKLKIIRLEERQ